MPTNYTPNYNLNQWEANDQVRRTDFNADNAKIDTALADLEAGKASAAALETLRTSVSSKASLSELNSLKTIVTNHGTSLAARNCMAHFEIYTGDGADTTTFSFAAKPWAVLFLQPFYFGILAVRGCKQPYVIGGDSRNFSCTFSWVGNSVTVKTASNYLNQKDLDYTLLALLEA